VVDPVSLLPALEPEEAVPLLWPLLASLCGIAEVLRSVVLLLLVLPAEGVVLDCELLLEGEALCVLVALPAGALWSDAEDEPAVPVAGVLPVVDPVAGCCGCWALVLWSAAGLVLLELPELLPVACASAKVPASNVVQRISKPFFMLLLVLLC